MAKQLADAHEVFALYDDDGDGQIAVENLSVAAHSLGVKTSQVQLEDVLAGLGARKKLDFAAFEACIAQLQTASPELEKLVENFKVFDIEGNGCISKENLVKVMRNLGVGCSEAEVEEIIKEADTEGNGNINYHEFLKLMTL